MTFLSIVQNVAKNAGLSVPGTAQTTSDDEVVKLAQFVNESGQELARRVDWGVLRKSATLAGLGTTADFVVAADFDRLSRGLNVVSQGNPVRGSLTPDEWFSLVPAVGSPRYYYLRSNRIAFYPSPSIGLPVRVQYQTKNWVDGGGDRFTQDTQGALIPERLIELGATWRWRRHVGKDYSDHMAEYEAALADRAQFDAGERLP